MVNMEVTNDKLVNLGTNMVMEKLGIDESLAKFLLLQHDNVRKAIEMYHHN